MAERAEARDKQEEQDREAEERRESRLADVRAAERELAEQRSEPDRREQQLYFDRGALRGRETGAGRAGVRAGGRVAGARRGHHCGGQPPRTLAQVEGEETKKVVEDLSQQLDRVRADNAELRDQLADDDPVRLRELEARNRDLTQERERLTYELERLRGTVLANTTSNIRVRSLEGLSTTSR